MSSETGTRILDVAHTLLAERGFSAFSYADIAEAIHIRKASIHHHFPTKVALVLAVMERHRLRMVEAHAALDTHFALPADRLRKYIGYWESCIRSMTEPFCVAALLGAELPSLPPEIQAAVTRHFTTLRKWIAKTLKAGVQGQGLRLQASAEIEAELLMAAVHGGMLAARVHGSSTVYGHITNNALQRVLAA